MRFCGSRASVIMHAAAKISDPNWRAAESDSWTEASSLWHFRDDGFVRVSRPMSDRKNLRRYFFTIMPREIAMAFVVLEF